MSNHRTSLLLAVLLIVGGMTSAAQAGESFASAVREVSPKTVKIFGAGGFRGLESYQSGMLISAEGHILTAWSYVLDTNYITVILDDGRRFEEAKLLGADPRLELAVLKIDAKDLAHFDLSKAEKAEGGSRVLAFSNLYGVATGNEQVSVQHGVVATRTQLEARRGVYETSFRGQVYVLDAVTNNPGAAGGVLTDRRGHLLGMLGKELRNSMNNTWLNYAVPVDQMQQSVSDIIEGISRPVQLQDDRQKPELALNADLLGFALVPDVLERTPPFIDQVRSESPAAGAGLQPDDLVLFVNGRLVQSCKILIDELERIDRADPVKLTIIRQQELLEMELSLNSSATGTKP